ncbi:hypothetical protein GCK72_003329 [Caenorhabditis remanei]|uniref:Uncharacterized protein n=1 Tax=Caenorhabditis remanei TaxID=31234 RepID=A0A6A5HYS4_CAERE|nr:hypothetical protein GCK72_003329 [Caenorhabditis remanei]KAF1771502.1 hypothetical protein GCK72_003329 [Caenorhabditis remanei]
MADTVYAVIDIIDECLANGIFDYQKVSEGVDNIVAVGAILRDNGSNGPMDQLGELEGKLDELIQQMEGHFNQLSEIMGEDNDMYNDITEKVANLLSAVATNLGDPGQESFGNLMNIIEETAPLECAYQLEYLLEQESLNPILVNETEVDPQPILEGIYTQLLFVEAYLNGLIYDENMYGPEKIMDMVEEFQEDVEKWNN